MKKMMRGMLSITVRKKLITAFVLFLAVPSITIGLVSYNRAADELKGNLLDTAIGKTEMLSQGIDQLLVKEMENVDVLASRTTSAQIDKKDAATRVIIDDFVKYHPDLEILVLGNEKGEWMKSPDPGAQTYDPRERDWYKQAMASKTAIISEPYVSATTGNVVVAVAKQLADGKGVISVNVSIEALRKTVNNVKIGQKGYVYILDKNNNFLIHPDHKAGEKTDADFYKELYKKDSGILIYNLDGQKKGAGFYTNQLTGWKIVGTMVATEADQASRPILDRMLLVLIVSMLVGAVLIYLIIRSIHRPIARLVAASQKVSQGDLTETIEIKNKDEFGQLAATFNGMTKSLRDVLGEVNETSTQLAASSEELTASSEQTTKATEQVAEFMQEMAAGTDRQSRDARITMELVKEMSEGVKQIAGRANDVSMAAGEVTDQSATGMQSIQQAVNQMTAIGSATEEMAEVIAKLGTMSQEIGQIVVVISEIANQTNILSLNASIEAARAGEQGRGFAVVAKEVKKLAEQSALFSGQIATLIGEMQNGTYRAQETMHTAGEEVRKGVEVVHSAGQLFHSILGSIRDVAGGIQEVSAASQQIDASMETVSNSMETVVTISEKIASGTEDVSAASQEQLATMEEVSASAAALSRMAEDMQVLIERFKL